MSDIQHIAIICDGNRRWARAHALEVFKGHEVAVEKVIVPLVKKAASLDIPFITFWIFSTENWDRDPKEIAALMNLFRLFFDKYVDELDKENIRIQVIGDVSKFEPDIQEKIALATNKTKQNTGITITLAMNYGGHDELTRATRKLAADIRADKLQVADISADIIAGYLDTATMPDPDIIVRTSGELRLSGFMSWQSAYSEYFFPKWDFPEFSPEKLDEILAEYSQRQRRFGK